jgi:hypothetical protein
MIDFVIAICGGRRGELAFASNRRNAISTKSKFIVAAAIAMLGLASPAFAQSFNRSDGTGNELPSYYDGAGGLHAGIAPQQKQLAVHRNGMSAFARTK